MLLPILQGVFCSLFFLLAFSGTLNGQISNTGYLQFGPNQGLPSAEVHDICQSTDGLIWIATDRGVCSYNGYDFKNYGVKEGLTDPSIWRIIKDGSGRLWFVGLTGHLFYLENGTIRSHPENAIIAATQLNLVAHIKYTVTSDSLFLRFNRQGKILGIDVASKGTKFYDIKPISLGETVSTIRRMFSMTSMYEDLGRPEMDDIKSVKFFPPYESIVSSSFWCKTSKQMVVHCGGRNLGFYNSATGELDTLLTSSHTNILESIGESEKYACQRNVLAKLKHNGLDTLDVFDGQVSGMFVDNEGGVWVSTLSQGIYYKPNRHIRPAIRGGLEGEIGFLMKNENHGVWILNKTGSIWQADLRSSEKKNQFETDGRHPSATLTDGSTLNIWVTHLFEDTAEIDNVRFFLSDKKGYPFLWENSMISAGFSYDVKPDFTISRAHSDEYGKGFLTATNRGLVYLEKDSTRFYGEEFPELGKRMSHFILAGDSVILTSIGGGLMIYDLKKSSLRVINESNSDLPSTFCHHITQSTDGVFWISTNNGLAKVKKADLGLPYVPMTVFNTYDGLTSNETFRAEVFDSVLFVAGRRSVDRIDLNGKFERQNHDYKLRFSSVVADGTPLPLDEEMVVSPSTRNITVGFTSLCYRCAQNVTYYYKLDGSRDLWSTTSNRFVDFPQLSSGTHNIQLMAKGPKMNKSDIVSLKVVVLTPFFKRWWVMLTGFVLLCLTIFLFVSQHLARVNLRNQLVRYQYSAFSSQLKPHFVFNILSSIQNSFIKQRPEEGISQIGSLARLLRITLSSSDALFISLQKDLDNLESYMNLESIRHQIPFEYSIVLDLKSESSDLLVAPLIIQPLVENAIYHGIKPAEYPGEIKIDITEGENVLKISVTDNGIGINKAKQNKRQKSGEKSFGLTLIQKRVNMVQKMNKMRPNFCVKDLEEYNLKGTCISFSLPINTKHHENLPY